MLPWVNKYLEFLNVTGGLPDFLLEQFTSPKEAVRFLLEDDRKYYSKNIYKILGVTPQSEPQQIKQAYLKAAKLNHPDRNAGNCTVCGLPTDQHQSSILGHDHQPDPKVQGPAHERFVDASAAYAIISDPNRRKMYDDSTHFGEDPSPETPATVIYAPAQRNPYVDYNRDVASKMRRGKKLDVEG